MEELHLAYCGILCNSCKNYRKNANCQGCLVEPEMLDDCPNRTCCINKGYRTCAECPDFICDLLREVYAKEKPICKEGYCNILKIRECGVREWLRKQNEQN